MAIKDDSVFQNNLIEKYGEKYRRKCVDKPLPIQLMASRSFSSALTILDRLNGVPFAEVTASLYFFCKDAGFQNIAKAYEAQIELAGANEEKFIMGIHSFYNEITQKIRKQKQYQEIIDFMGAYLTLSHEYEYKDMGHRINDRVVSAYSNLLIQTTEYLRPDKFDLNQNLIGVTTEGEPMVGEAIYPLFDFPNFEVQRIIAEKKHQFSTEQVVSLLESLFRKQGLIIRSLEDIDAYATINRISENTATLMMPYINEYTCDMLPQEHYRTHLAAMRRLTVSIPVYTVESTLTRRKATLPTNGLIDSDTFIIKALRLVGLSQKMSNELIEFCMKVKTEPYDPNEHTNAIQTMYKRYSPKDIWMLASEVCTFKGDS